MLRKKILIIAAAIMACVLCVAGYVAVRQRTMARSAEGLPVSRILGDFAVNTDDPRAVVGFADHYFIATVDSVKNTEYRHEVDVTTADGGHATNATPYTEYDVTVVKNIKGTLPQDSAIELTKAGGVARDGKSVVLFENDTLPETGGTYVFAASVQPDGSLLVSGPHSNEVMSEVARPLTASATDEYQENYENEIVYSRERYQYRP